MKSERCFYAAPLREIEARPEVVARDCAAYTLRGAKRVARGFTRLHGRSWGVMTRVDRALVAVYLVQLPLWPSSVWT